MKLLNKIKKWFKDLNKTKCPNCKCIKLERLEKKFVRTTSRPYYNHSKYEALSNRVKKSPDGYDEYEVYDVKYQCKECKTIFQKEEEYLNYD